MNKGLYIARKNYLFCLIQRLSDMCGGDDKEWLKDYYSEVLDMYPDDRIEEAIEEYKFMIKELKDS